MADTPSPLRERNRQLARDVVLDAAERLLKGSEAADFSMRGLAAEAGVGFATPFNHFGSKNAIMQALSARLIGRMASRFQHDPPAGDAIERVLAMGRISVALLLEQPDVYKAVIGSLGVVGEAQSAVRPQSQQLWSLALADCAGLTGATRDLARASLPEHLAFVFRGCLSFWIAGEVRDGELAAAFDAGASTALLGFADAGRRPFILRRITDSTMSRAGPEGRLMPP